MLGRRHCHFYDTRKYLHPSCGFCAVATGKPEAVDWDEPQRVAEAIHLMKVKHAVITSVDRDELKDQGSIIWYNTIKAIKALNPNTTLETLIPDFKADAECIQRIIDAAPEVVSHNIETVERLTKQVRIQAKYWRSMETLRMLKRRRHAYQKRHHAGAWVKQKKK